MIQTSVALSYIDDPFPFFFGGPLLSDEDLVLLNSDLPARELYSREIKTGKEHKKQYHMWRSPLFEKGAHTEAASCLPAAWQTLLENLLEDQFRIWLAQQTEVDLAALPVTIGLYVFENGDFTTVDSGKVEKALSVALYLNHEWASEDGGNLHLWQNKGAYEIPARTFVPRGGHVVVGWWGKNTWHNIGAVRNERSRISMMIEYWKR